MDGRADTESGAFPRKILWNKKRFMGVWVKQGCRAGWGQGLAWKALLGVRVPWKLPQEFAVQRGVDF